MTGKGSLSTAVRGCCWSPLNQPERAVATVDRRKAVMEVESFIVVMLRVRYDHN